MIEELAERIVAGYEHEMVERIFGELTSRIAKRGRLLATDLPLVEQAARISSERVEAILAKHNPKIAKGVQAEVTEALMTADKEMVAGLASIYGTETSLSMEMMARFTAKQLADVIARQNVAFAGNALAVYQDVLAQAMIDWNAQALPRERIIARAVDRLLDEGVSTIDYISGRRMTIDAAIRRHITTTMNSSISSMTMQRMQEYGHDLVRVSAHFGARPEHAEWQGKIYSLSGKGRPNFYAATGYGTPTGLMGINCRHVFGPAFPGDEEEKLPEKIRGLTNDQMYAYTQKQRGFERRMRDADARLKAYERVGLGPDDDQVVSLKLRKQKYDRALDEISAKTGLGRRRELERGYVAV